MPEPTYRPIADYAAIGDGRTVALVSRDGSIDWLPLPNLDSPSVFASILDAKRGGSCLLTPDVPFKSERRYLPGTNVLETTFRTDRGAVRVTDALTLPDRALNPIREMQRRVDALSGRVPMRWRVEPRFGYGQAAPRIALRSGVPIVSHRELALAVLARGAGEPEISSEAVEGRFVLDEGSRATLALCFAGQEPLVVPATRELEARLESTAETWRQWTGQHDYEGPWRDAVIRSLLALKLLVFAPSGAVAAAATTSLPEHVGGERNWDYRYSWVRDSAFTLDALLELGCHEEAQAYFWWLMHASQRSHPRLHVLYDLEGGIHAGERECDLNGYEGSRPVRIGNAAVDQIQLDTYGELMQAAWLYARAGHPIDRDFGQRLAEIADYVCHIWRQPDYGIWEVRDAPRHFTQSKMMCWVALERALALTEAGHIPARSAPLWLKTRQEIRDFIEGSCWSERHGGYARFAGGEELDAAVLLGLLFGYGDPVSSRWSGTIVAIERDLARGPYVLRYTGDDGLSGDEGAFLSCSFWLAEALARTGRAEEGARLMDQLVGVANDVGLYAEEVDPATGAFLGNLPQGLSHLSLISAAHAFDWERRA
jgi:GH15 family glucan-1,4-alpha-glucosidase